MAIPPACFGGSYPQSGGRQEGAGERRRQGTGTATFNSVWYGIKKTLGPITSSQIVYIGADRGELKCVSCSQWSGRHTIDTRLGQ